MKNNTREIFYAWKEFLNEGETKSSLLSENFSNNFKQDKISEIKSLVEWGDKLEEFINENVEIRLLETHYLNEGLWADFKRSKDNVKNKINPTDVQRSIRAYEVKKFTKKTLTQWFEKTTMPFDDQDLVKILIYTKREDLVQKIEKRVNKMIRDGAI